MLTERQRAHYEAFGFLFQRELFSADEMSVIGEEADRIWQEESQRPGFELSDQGSVRLADLNGDGRDDMFMTYRLPEDDMLRLAVALSR